jgi:transcription termination factor Rho
MTSVLDRSALEQSPLADLHLIANELGVDGFRRLRKADLVDAILAKQGGDENGDGAAAPSAEDEDAPRRGRRGRRGGRGRSRNADEDGEEGATDEDAGDDEPVAAAAAPKRGRSRSRGGAGDREERPPRGGNGNGADEEDKTVEGEVELLANGSGFVRLSPPESTDDDVYISAAQVKRCELVTGDRVGGPVRAPRRSERFPSMIRIDTINGRPADEVAEGTRFEDLPAVWPAERIEFGSDDPTVQAIEWLTPVGKGSRAVISGPARAGKSEALRRLAAALAGRDGLELTVVLAGVRPEEVADWRAAGTEPVAALTFAASADAQAQALEQAIEQGRRVAARGGDAVVLVDSLDYIAPGVARRALAAARNIDGGGSLTVVAAAPAPVGGETTVVALHAGMTSLGRFPAIDLAASGTLRAELLVGEAGAEAIAKARADQG